MAHRDIELALRCESSQLRGTRGDCRDLGERPAGLPATDHRVGDAGSVQELRDERSIACGDFDLGAGGTQRLDNGTEDLDMRCVVDVDPDSQGATTVTPALAPAASSRTLRINPAIPTEEYLCATATQLIRIGVVTGTID